MSIKPITVDLGLHECCDLDLDSLRWLSDRYYESGPAAWSILHEAVMRERLRRIQSMRSRGNEPGGVTIPPSRTEIPADLRARSIEDGFNSLRRCYLMVEPFAREATGEGCVCRAVLRVLLPLIAGFHAAALRFADAEAVRRVAAARAFATN